MSAPTPPPGAAPQAGQGSGFNPAKWNIFDKIALGAGVLFFIFSFISGFGKASGSSSFGGGSSSWNAWHGWSWLGLLLVFAAIVLVALKAAEGILPDTLPLPLITAGLAGGGWILLLIAGFTQSIPGCSGSDICSGGTVGGYTISVGLGWAGWVLLIIGLVVAAAAIIPLTSAAGDVEAKLNQAAGQFGGHNNGGNNQPPAAGGSSEYPPPPAN